MPENNPWLSRAFSFLDQSQTYQYQTPETLGPVGAGLAGASAGLNIATAYANLYRPAPVPAPTQTQTPAAGTGGAAEGFSLGTGSFTPSFFTGG